MGYSKSEQLATKTRVIWIGYTTHYRDGSLEFARVAKTLEADLSKQFKNIRCFPIYTKSDFIESFNKINQLNEEIEQLHFIGHSGMYGPMYGTTTWPEQLSPHEWRTLSIPFIKGALAFFHACRTARWFAPFFAHTFNVITSGHHGYTTFSSQPTRFVLEKPFALRQGPLYAVSCHGKKTHGVLGSIKKYTGQSNAIPMTVYRPSQNHHEGTYDNVATLYDQAFSDIRVRQAEWTWLIKKIDDAFGQTKPRILDIGCGNGALLNALSNRISYGEGVDASAMMIERARNRNASSSHLHFQKIEGPILPFPDEHFDIVISFLSFRYLDWDPMIKEIKRVLTPNGRLLVVDMAEKSISLNDAPILLSSTMKHFTTRIRKRSFIKALKTLTSHPEWEEMLKHNPIRAEHEYRWFFESRFPMNKLETLTVTRTQRLVAFDTGPIGINPIPPIQYP